MKKGNERKNEWKRYHSNGIVEGERWANGNVSKQFCLSAPATKRPYIEDSPGKKQHTKCNWICSCIYLFFTARCFAVSSYSLMESDFDCCCFAYNNLCFIVVVVISVFFAHLGRRWICTLYVYKHAFTLSSSHFLLALSLHLDNFFLSHYTGPKLRICWFRFFPVAWRFALEKTENFLPKSFVRKFVKHSLHRAAQQLRKMT